MTKTPTNATPSLTDEERTAIIGWLNSVEEPLSRELPEKITRLKQGHTRFLAGKVQNHTSGYLLVKHGLESLLARGDGEEMEGVYNDIFSPNDKLMREEEKFTAEEIKGTQERIIRRFFERVYWEIYRDDPTFRREVIATDIEALKNDDGIV